MKNPARHVSLLATALLGLLLAPSVHAVPSVRLRAPDSITPFQPFRIGVCVDGIKDEHPFLGPDELLAFGFKVKGAILEGQSGDRLVFHGYEVGDSFEDDTGAIFPDHSGAVAGSAFPGAKGDDILLAELMFTVETASPSASVLLGFDLSTMSDNFSAGLFTLLHSGLLEPFETVVVLPVGERVPEIAGARWLLASSTLGLIGWHWNARRLSRGRALRPCPAP